MLKLLPLLMLGFLINVSVHAEETEKWADALSIKAVDTKPVPIKQGPPIVPSSLKKAVGVIHVSFVIDVEGKVPSAKIVKSTNEDLNDVALETVKKWEFKPAMNVGVAIPVRAIVPVRFK